MTSTHNDIFNPKWSAYTSIGAIISFRVVQEADSYKAFGMYFFPNSYIGLFILAWFILLLEAIELVRS